MRSGSARLVRSDARLLLVAGSASLLDSAAIISVGAALPLWRADLDLSDAEVGIVSATMTVAIAVGALGGGRLADRTGRGRVFASSVGAYAVGAVLVALATSWPALVIAVGVLGLASGADLPASIALVAERVPAEVRGRMVAATHVMWTVGIVVASAASFSVSALGLAGMRGVFAGLGAAAVVTWAVRHHVLAHPPSERAEAVPHRRLADAAGSGPADLRTLAAVAVFYVLYTLVANTFGSFRTYLLVAVGGVQQTLATGISFAVTLVGLAGTVVFSVIADSSWRRRLYPVAAGALVGSQVLLALTIGSSLAVTVAALVLNALAYPYVGEGLYKVWAQDTVAPRSRASFQGATIAAARAIAALFALVTPSLLARDPAALFWLLSAIATAAMALGWMSRRASGRTAVQSSP